MTLKSSAATERPSMKRHAIVSGVTAAIGFIALLATLGGIPPDNFWHPYVLATRRVGTLLAIFGMAWLVLALAHEYFHFFDLDRRLEGNQFGACLAAVVILMIVMFVTIMPHVPDTPPSMLPPDPASRLSVMRMEANFARLVGCAIVVTGLTLLSVPFRRLLRS